MKKYFVVLIVMLALVMTSCNISSDNDWSDVLIDINGEWQMNFPDGDYRPFGPTEAFDVNVTLTKNENQLIFSGSQSFETLTFDLDNKIFSGNFDREIGGELYRFSVIGNIESSNFITMLETIIGYYDGETYLWAFEVVLTR